MHSPRSILGAIGVVSALVLTIAIAPAVSAAGPSTVWTRQFGTNSNDDARAVATDAARNAYVAGCSDGALPGQTHKGELDVFVRKYRPNGSLAWTRQFGTSSNDCAGGVAVDKSGRVYVAGYVGGALPGQSHSGQSDGFLRKMRPDGSTVWTRQFGISSWDYAEAVAIDKAGRIIVSGDTMGALPGKVHRGGTDAFLRKFRPAGSTVWTRQYGSSDDDYGQSVAIDKDNRIVVRVRAQVPPRWEGELDPPIRHQQGRPVIRRRH